VATKSQELGGALYAQQSAEGAAPGADAPAEDDGVVDAEVVEDEDK
jgi:molecular chaperone DnaK